MQRSLPTLLLLATSVALPRAEAQAAPRFTLTSSEVQQGRMLASAQMFNGMGCTGHNVSPALAWRGAPAGTKSFAITMYDPDAPTGSGWWHWVIYNIPAATTSLPAGAGEAGKALLANGAAQGNTDFGVPGYGGACPPPGDTPHHYRITVYALDVDKLDVPAGATA
ncbi:MAG: YbhB/YbcL family Raf kinase inhibitor-like protein, partial [Gemmatimonadales bacterium]